MGKEHPAGIPRLVVANRGVEGKQGNNLLSVFSYILDRARLARGMNGDVDRKGRNVYAAFGYPDVISLEDILARYLRGGIAKRVVDAFPNATWGAPPEIVSDKARFTKAWQDLNTKIDIWSMLRRADILSRLGQYSTMLIGTDRANLAVPLQGATKVLYLQPYAQLTARVATYDTNQSSPRYQKPQTYDVSPSQMTKLSAVGYSTPTTDPEPSLGSGFKVDQSRMLHVAEDTLEDDVYGIPALQPIWNYLLDLEKVGGAAAENFWTSANRGMQLDVDKDMDFSSDDADALSEEIDEYMNSLRRVIRTRGVTINPLSGDINDPKGTYDMIIDVISGTTGIPRRILLGTESGHLASTQDKGNWAERVEEYRLLKATPNILDPFIWLLVDGGVLPDPGNYYYLWPDAYRVGPNDRGMQAAQTSRAMSNLVRGTKDWQSIVVQRKQLKKTPEPVAQPAPTPSAPPNGKVSGEKDKAGAPTVHEERTPVEDDLAHEASGQQGSDPGKTSGGKGTPMTQPVNPATLPVDLPDLPDMLMSYDEMRRVVGLSTDGRILDQNTQKISGRRRV